MTANIKPKTIFTGDNLPIMRGINSKSVDLIYLDPPFNSNANYAAPIGSKSAGAEFKDTWTLYLESGTLGLKLHGSAQHLRRKDHNIVVCDGATTLILCCFTRRRYPRHYLQKES